MFKQITLVTFLIVIVISLSYIYKPICPQDFKDPNERFASFFEWEKEFRQDNPNADIPALSKARKDFYTEYNCKEATQEPYYDGIESGVMSQQLLNIIENYNL